MSLWSWLPFVSSKPSNSDKNAECDHEMETVVDGYTCLEEYRPEDRELIFELHQSKRRVCSKCGAEYTGVVGNEVLEQHVFEADRVVDDPEETIW